MLVGEKETVTQTRVRKSGRMFLAGYIWTVLDILLISLDDRARRTARIEAAAEEPLCPNEGSFKPSGHHFRFICAQTTVSVALVYCQTESIPLAACTRQISQTPPCMNPSVHPCKWRVYISRMPKPVQST